MSDFNDKTQTFKFRPVREDKPQVNRSEDDEYSAARKNHENEKREEGSGNALTYVAIILAVLLIAAIIAGIFILRPKDEPEQKLPEDNIAVTLPEEEEETEEKKDITVSCSMVFYSDSVIKKDGGYTILADLYDTDFYKFDNRKLIINDDTDIREDGKRLSADALIYLIESMAGEGIVFDGEIKEEDGTVLSITFDGSFREEMEQPGEETEGEGEEETPSVGEEIPEGEGEAPVGELPVQNDIPADVQIGETTN